MLAAIRHRQGRVMGKMESLGFKLQNEANLQTLTLDVLKSSEIEGELLDAEQVRSSIARRLGLDVVGLVPADRNVEGVVEMMLDATQEYKNPLTSDRLFKWHTSLFPNRKDGSRKIVVGAWRDNKDDDPMQVVSGAIGREVIHFEAPAANRLDKEMKLFLDWVNDDNTNDPVIKAAIAHLWFVTVHPFDDGNGRIARAIADMQLARGDESTQRFYSMSAQIRKDRRSYHDILEKTQKDSMDITNWLTWFLQCIDRAIAETDQTLATVLRKARFGEINSTAIFNPRQHVMVNKLLDVFEGKLNTSKWARINKVSTDTALRDIQDLLAKGILKKEDGGGRSTSYILSIN